VHGPRHPQELDAPPPHAPPPLALRARLAYELAAARALTHLHAHGVLHCDVKLSNVLITAGDDPHAKLGDFGLSIELARQERIDYVRGTPRYMAPEVAFLEYGLAADVYSYGICLYEILHGVRFLSEIKRPRDVLLAAINGHRPCARLTTAQYAALEPADGRFADTAAALIEQCWDQDWQVRPSMADVTMQILLRRMKTLDDNEWQSLQAYVHAHAAGSTTSGTPAASSTSEAHVSCVIHASSCGVHDPVVSEASCT
jgi:serine/threonine protein kinase